MNDANPDPPERLDRPRPRIGAGILATLVVTPGLAGIGLAISDGAIATPFAIFCTAIAVLFCFALPAHFFVGHRATWLLPALVTVMGLVSLGVGIGTGNGLLIKFGLPMSIVGLGWNFPDRVPGPLGRWIAARKAFFNRRVPTKP
jgi:hypothetical protein